MIICRGTNVTDGQLFTTLFRDKLSLQGACIKREQKIQFVKNWKVKHHSMLVEGGLENGTALHKFVSGIFMCTSAAKQNVPLLQTVYQANAAHMNFGKYTLYSCYHQKPS